jgi:ATP-dependent exoDNAse (exonuclease V), alpha subunit - helicase superfamily I member
MSNYEWTNDQRECMNEAIKWYKKQYKQVFEYAGWAGVGKTTIVPHMIRKMGLEMDEVLAVAFTGKAASNLTVKGIPATSAHAGFMEAIQVPKTDRNGNVLKRDGRILKTWSFRRKQFLPKNIKLIFIDEGYFLPDELGAIAESFGLPVCVCGDPGQLGPVYGKPRYLKNPDYFINEITRQGKESGIVEVATLIRSGEELPNKKTIFKKDAFVIPKEEITDTLLLNCDIILCGKNKTRNYFNKRIRNDILGIKSKLPVKGDKIICRHNYWNRMLEGIPLTNGVIGHVIHDVPKSSVDLKSGVVRIDFMPDYTNRDYYINLPIDIKYFQEECGMHEEDDDPYNKRYGIKMELSHAITTHISQGSDFPSVLYWDEVFGDSDTIRRLRYTGATRAKEILIIAV